VSLLQFERHASSFRPAPGVNPRGSKMMNDTFRVIVLVFLATHVPATVLMDSQALVPKSMVPKFAQRLLEFHISTNHDPLMDDQPVWFKSFILCELLFQLPFFIIGFRAFYMKRNWIRIPGLVYGGACCVFPKSKLGLMQSY
tara:strand:+ start:2152 stop:2577 length:426 start_codon:yes stop_codon:yes gene_type:complete